LRITVRIKRERFARCDIFAAIALIDASSKDERIALPDSSKLCGDNLLVWNRMRKQSGSSGEPIHL